MYILFTLYLLRDTRLSIKLIGSFVRLCTEPVYGISIKLPMSIKMSPRSMPNWPANLLNDSAAFYCHSMVIFNAFGSSFAMGFAKKI